MYYDSYNCTLNKTKIVFNNTSVLLQSKFFCSNELSFFTNVMIEDNITEVLVRTIKFFFILPLKDMTKYGCDEI